MTWRTWILGGLLGLGLVGCGGSQISPSQPQFASFKRLVATPGASVSGYEIHVPDVDLWQSQRIEIWATGAAAPSRGASLELDLDPKLTLDADVVADPLPGIRKIHLINGTHHSVGVAVARGEQPRITPGLVMSFRLRLKDLSVTAGRLSLGTLRIADINGKPVASLPLGDAEVVDWNGSNITSQPL